MPVRLVLAFLPLAGLGLACGPAGRPLPVTVPAPALEPWQVPEAELGTQRLFRAHYSGPDGGGSFRLTLRLVALDRWQAQANALGRKLWSLEADGSSGLWIDHRKKIYCRLQDRLELAGSLLAPLPFRSFPALLLGRLPEPPAHPGASFRGPEVVFSGGAGRRWRARVEDGQVVRWTLGQGRRTVAWWELEDGEAVLSDRDHDVRLRWRPVVREPLADLLEPLAPPPGYRAIACRGLEIEIREGEGEPPV